LQVIIPLLQAFAGERILKDSGRTPSGSEHIGYLHIHEFIIIFLVSGFNPSEKYENQLGLLLSTYGKIKNAPNNQPG
jgi:hypothetical protein